MNISLPVSVLVLAFTMDAFCEHEVPAPPPPPAPTPVPAPVPVSTPPPTVTLPNSTTDQIGRTLTPRVNPEVPAERIVEVLTGALMNRGGMLEAALTENPELGDKVRRWLTARERMERVRRDRDRRTEAKRTADRMRDAARQMRINARNESNPGLKAHLESTATALDQGANAQDASATATPEQRQEGRDAEKELKQAEKDVPDHIKTEVDNAINEQNQPPQREAQERVEIGPDGEIIESPPGR